MTLDLPRTRQFLGNALLVRGALSLIAYAVMVMSGVQLGYTPLIVKMIVFFRVGRDCEFYRATVSLRLPRARADEI